VVGGPESTLSALFPFGPSKERNAPGEIATYGDAWTSLISTIAPTEANAAQMNELPQLVIQSRLYRRLLDDEDLAGQLRSLRGSVLALAGTTSRTIPDFTDHTVRHMDALWMVAEQVLTPDEISRMTHAEVFLLCCCFYLHDIGMAFAATEDGLQRIKNCDAYRSFMAAIPEPARRDPSQVARGLSFAVRRLHADAAMELATNVVPGSGGRYLIEAGSFREAWATTCGEIASSHHWSLPRLESRLGPQGEVPLPGGRRGDLLFVAACLRIIDYAHINRDRAPTIDRAFRLELDPESLTHWLAQENIDGPVRADAELVYHAAKPISDVDAWWLYYEMLTGLDQEIRFVKKMLDQRREGLKRISLQGVRGASAPEEAAKFIPTAGFLPIDVNLRAGSIERLVELLAGETLYGPNPMAAVRELVQNARDAVLLKAEIATSEAERATLSIPIRVRLDTKSNPPILEIVDHGVGMTRRVMIDYLISIASDYWTTQFPVDFPAVAEKGFKNAGRFGIGFLSVFMLGAEVTVQSNRVSGERNQLSLRGVGRRGEIRQLPSPPGSGTAIRIELRPASLEHIQPLDQLVPIYAPTLPHPISIDVDGALTDYPVGWILALRPDDFQEWVSKALDTMRRQSLPRRGYSREDLRDIQFVYRRYALGTEREASQWPLRRPEYVRGTDRLLASFEGESLLCLRGLAIQPVRTPGFTGIIDLDTAALDASRSRTVNADLSGVLEAARQSVAPQVIENLNALGQDGLIVEKMPLIASCVRFYGEKVIMDSDVPWISELRVPGNVELINSKVFLAKVERGKSVFIAFNTGPWTAMKEWVKGTMFSGNTDVAILIDGKDQPTPGYLSEATGSLIELWEKFPNSPLFAVLIRIVAQAWQTNLQELSAQQNWTQRRDTISGWCCRP
jgi:hypothetical protein